MAETPPGINDLLNLLGTANPLAALTKNLDSLKKGVETFVAAVTTFTRTMEALEDATKRVSSLLDDMEQPVRNVVNQLASLPPQAISQAVTNLNLLSSQMGQLIGPLSGVAGLASGIFGAMRPTESPAPPASDTPAPPPPAAKKKPAAATRAAKQQRSN